MGRAMHQHEHEAHNAANYPGTRQLCSSCSEPTGRCEEDSMFAESGPVCEACYDEFVKSQKPGECTSCGVMSENVNHDVGWHYCVNCAL